MENPRSEKVAVVDEVRDKLSNAEAAVLTEYRGLSVAALAELRRTLRQAGGDYKIYKNTLVRFAARDLGMELDELLTGPTAIAFVDGDLAGVAKALRDYAKTNPNLVVKGGLLGTKVISGGDVNALADLPSREVLLSEIAGLFAAPAQRFAGLLDAIPRNFAYALQALIDQGGAGLAPEPAPAAEAAPAADDAPADEAPAADAPADEAAAAEAPADEAPAADDAAPADEAPADEAPADEAPAEEAPAAEADNDTTNTDDAPADDAAAPAEES